MSGTGEDPVAHLVGAVGEGAVRATVRAFYAAVPGDDVLGPMYPPDDLAGAEERLGDFLVMRFGGSPRYMERRGHPRLRMRHAPFAIDAVARERWVSLMDRALDVEWPDESTRETARAFLRDVATFLRNA